MSWQQLIVRAIQEALSDLFKEHGVFLQGLQRFDLAKDGAILRTKDGAVYVISVQKAEEKA